MCRLISLRLCVFARKPSLDTICAHVHAKAQVAKPRRMLILQKRHSVLDYADYEK